MDTEKLTGVSWVIRNAEQRNNLLSHIAKVPYPYAVKIQDPDPPRTGKQLNYVHSLLHALALGTGTNIEIAKRDSKVEFGITIVHRSVITGEKTARLLSFGEYKKKQLSDFISHLEVYLAEQQIPFEAAE